MSAPPYRLLQSAEFQKNMRDMQRKKQYLPKLRKVVKTLHHLQEFGPGYPGLRSHPYQSVKGPNGNQLWESYVENHTAAAWRLFWEYGPGPDELTLVTVGPHP